MDNIEITKYHIRLEAKGIFPQIKSFRLTEIYIMDFTSFQKALEFGEKALEIFKQKANLLGNVETIEQLYVSPGEEYLAYGHFVDF